MMPHCTDRPLSLLVLNWLDRLNPLAGGAETHLHEIYGRLTQRGHRVTLVASGWRGAPAHELVDGIEVQRTGGRHCFLVEGPRRGRRLLDTRPVDLVVEDFNKAPLYAPLWSRVPVVLVAHHLFGWTAFRSAGPPVAVASWLLEQTLPFAYRRVPVQAVSASTADDLTRRGFERGNLVVIHNGVDTAFLTPDPAGAREAVPTFVYLGRLQPYKRVDLAVRAVARLTRAREEVRLVIAGRGAAEAALRALAERLGVAHRVRFAGFVSETQKRELFRRAWANVFTSPREGWGLTTVEAGACGTPTVASDSPGLRDAVVHGRTGLLVPHGDVTALADALRSLARSLARVRALGHAARRLAERFSWDRAADATEAHLCAVRAAGGVPPRAAGVELRRRDPRARIPLPRNGREPTLPYGCSGYTAIVRAGGCAPPVEVRAVLGALDCEGRRPALLLRLTSGGRPVLRELDGWPVEHATFVAAALRDALGEAAVIEEIRAGAS